jgi:predicted Zn-dependent protease
MKPKHFILSIIVFIAVLALACAFVPTATPPAGGYRYDNLPDAAEGDVAEYRAVSAWDKTQITYFFLNGTDKIPGDREHELVRAAFKLWADQTPLSFTEAGNAEDADILIRWASGDHGDGDPFDGPGDVLAHASYPNPYRDRQVFLHFDDDERWVDSDSEDVDLLSVAAHEIGHNLGLDHSKDPNALMYPSYRGPQRSLGTDDIAGVQSLYGARAQVPSAPQVPQPQATKPSTDEKDSDGDGLSDSGETLITGTDPNNPDSDGDGLLDGVEVYNRMNPLDPDMDNDGASDGDEVAAGTNPLLPDQANGISPDLANEISSFLSNAINLEIEAYRKSDASVTASVFGPTIQASMEKNISDLNDQGLIEIAEIDYYKSYIHNIRLVSNTHIEVQTCEVWTTQLYRKANGLLAKTDGPTLLPQTITLERLQNGWFITNVEFADAPAFCRE